MSKRTGGPEVSSLVWATLGDLQKRVKVLEKFQEGVEYDQGRFARDQAVKERLDSLRNSIERVSER